MEKATASAEYQGADPTPEEETQAAAMAAFATSLIARRKAAIDYRKNSGIEDDWLADEEAYEGIDDANRGEKDNALKPRGINGAFESDDAKPVRSTAYLNITRPYVDAAAARVADMLLPTDDRNWAIEATPIPDLAEQLPGIDPASEIAVKAQEEIEQLKKDADQRAKQAQEKIDDHLDECQWQAELRKVIQDSARIGVGVVKGPIAKRKRLSRIQARTEGREFKMVPASKQISPWDLFPDPSCGGDIQRGSFIFERDRLTVRQLRELRENPTYLPTQIDACLREGPDRRLVDDKDETQQLKETEQYEIWYFHGYVSRADLEAHEYKVSDNLQRTVPAIVSIINDRVVRIVRAPVDTEDFPFDVIPWQARKDRWDGIGVGHQMRAPQRMLNAAGRNMLDNAGLSAGPQIITLRDVVEPEDGNWQMTPRKHWFANPEADIQDVQRAFMAINIPSMQGELMAIIEFAMKMAEDVTGLPQLMQGQQGDAPETVGGMQILTNNAATVLRRMARLFDDRITEPHITRYYKWVNINEDRGDMVINARGSSALVERDLQNQAILQMGAMTMQPAFGINPRKWATEWLKSQRLDPTSFEYTDDELKEMQQQQQQQQPEDPAAAKAKMDQEVTVAKMQFDAEQAQLDREHDLALRQMDLSIKAMEFAEKRGLQLDSVKADLAKFAMGERSKRDLFEREAAIKERHGEGI